MGRRIQRAVSAFERFIDRCNSAKQGQESPIRALGKGRAVSFSRDDEGVINLHASNSFRLRLDSGKVARSQQEDEPHIAHQNNINLLKLLRDGQEIDLVDNGVINHDALQQLKPGKTYLLINADNQAKRIEFNSLITDAAENIILHYWNINAYGIKAAGSLNLSTSERVGLLG